MTAGVPSRLTSLDFFEIRESIKSYLRTRTEFTDYDFEGSAASYLLDTLAYNTYYTAFNANMAVNELFLESSTIRDNVVKIAKLLNYTPASLKAARACIKLQVQTTLNADNVYPQYVTLKAGDNFVSSTDNESFTFCTIKDEIANVEPVTGIATFNNLIIYQGNRLSYNYTVDNTINQEFIIPNEDVDTDLLEVFLKPSEQSKEIDTYTPVKNITTLDGTSRVYFLEEIEDTKYKIIFGDGIIGRKLINGEYITITYVKTRGITGNGCKLFYCISDIQDSNNRSVDPSRIRINTIQGSRDAVDREDITTIKYRAPRIYSAQYRAVTEQDYETITQMVYPSAVAVKAYGGETLTPPIYGKVYVAIKTKSGTQLNEATKKSIVKNLKEYAMASIEPVIVAADEMTMNIKTFVYYDPNLTTISNTDLIGKVTGMISQYNDQSNLNKFGNRIDYSKLSCLIDTADPSIKGNVTQVSLTKKYSPTIGENNQTCLYFGQPIVNPNSYVGNGSANGNSDISCKALFNAIISNEFYVEGITERLINLNYSDQLDAGIFVSNSDQVKVPVRLRDDGKGTIQLITTINSKTIILKDSIGTVDYKKGIVCFGPLTIGGVVSASGTGTTSIADTINITVLPTSPIVTPPPGTLLDISIPTIVPQDITVTINSAGTFDPFTLSPGALGSINDLNLGEILTGFPDIDDPSITSCF
jgi:hypothetical protein